MSSTQSELRDIVAKCLVEAVQTVAGGNLNDDAERKKLLGTAASSISFPNKCSQSSEGKPHDMEIRIALSLFHRWKQRRSSATPTETLEIISDMGVTRQVVSPRELAEMIILPLESACRREGVAHDVRSQPSGLICIVTTERSRLLRQAGKLPCPHCTKWCQGEKGLWWHQQENHKIEYAEAAEVAASSTDTLAMILYDPRWTDFLSGGPERKQFTATPLDCSQPLDYVKEGGLEALKREVQVSWNVMLARLEVTTSPLIPSNYCLQNGYVPAQEMDKRGASPLIWAAGGGHLSIVRYLVEECGCDPNQPQRGKRSFSGRTPLHWAARNGHLEVVRCLLQEYAVDIEAATIDGTTAFCWASWQGHVAVMDCLVEQGCDVNTTNSFGCNAVLWAAQGKGDANIMEWFEAKGCDMIKVNNNGHGVLHKAAQRGQQAVCQWFYERWIKAGVDIETALRLVAPDMEGYCPSDLAGMEGHGDLAKELARMEMELITSSNVGVDLSLLPPWLTAKHEGISMHISENERFHWERFGGQRRMRSRLRRDPIP